MKQEFAKMFTAISENGIFVMLIYNPNIYSFGNHDCALKLYSDMKYPFSTRCAYTEHRQLFMEL